MAIQREYRKWHSSCLNREMELLVFGHAGARVLVLPARMGRFYDYENWRMVEALTPQYCGGKYPTFLRGQRGFGIALQLWYHATSANRSPSGVRGLSADGGIAV